MNQKVSKKCKFISVLLYLLPIIFFAASYFLMITSGEDVRQGANRAPNVIHDAVASFMWSARTSDMYHHAVINFYTYTSFPGSIGNIIFRLINVLSAGLIIYLCLRLILNRKPTLRIKDALLANLFFVLLIFSAHAQVLFRGFSLINNYQFIAIAALLFCLPFICDISQKRKHGRIYSFWMVVAGFLFGTSHNVTPLAFLLALALYLLYLRYIEKQKHVLRNYFSNWKICALVGVVIGLIFCYAIGPGVSGYSDSNYVKMYDYVSLADVAKHPTKNLVRIAVHMRSNFKEIFSPLYLPIIIGLLMVLYAKNVRHIKFKKWTTSEKRTLVAICLFAFTYWLAMSQVQKLTRLYFPAFVAALIACLFVFNHYFVEMRIGNFGKKLSVTLVVVLLFLSIFAVVDRTYVAVKYYKRVAPQLEMINNSSEEEVCVHRKDNYEKAGSFVDFRQEETFEDWALPTKVYGKKVTMCEE